MNDEVWANLLVENVDLLEKNLYKWLKVLKTRAKNGEYEFSLTNLIDLSDLLGIDDPALLVTLDAYKGNSIPDFKAIELIQKYYTGKFKTLVSSQDIEKVFSCINEGGYLFAKNEKGRVGRKKPNFFLVEEPKAIVLYDDFWSDDRYSFYKDLTRVHIETAEKRYYLGYGYMVFIMWRDCLDDKGYIFKILNETKGSQDKKSSD